MIIILQIYRFIKNR